MGQLNSVNLLLPSNLEAQKMLTLISRTSHTGFLIRFNGFFYDPGNSSIYSKGKTKTFIMKPHLIQAAAQKEQCSLFQFLVNICSILLVPIYIDRYRGTYSQIDTYFFESNTKIVPYLNFNVRSPNPWSK